jgi:hypothetical protein
MVTIKCPDARFRPFATHCGLSADDAIELVAIYQALHYPPERIVVFPDAAASTVEEAEEGSDEPC